VTGTVFAAACAFRASMNDFTANPTYTALARVVSTPDRTPESSQLSGTPLPIFLITGYSPPTTPITPTTAAACMACFRNSGL
jgi:hypothetical protein